METDPAFAAALARAIGPVARELLGEPNGRLSREGELRFGTNGSLSVDLAKGTFFDHEAGVGGGTLDLLRQRGRMVNGAGLAWLEERNLIPSRKQAAPRPHSKRRIAATYDYRDTEGALRFQVVRFEPKQFRQRRPDPAASHGWAWNLEGVERLPYRLPELLSAIANGDPVFVAEGEKAVEAVVSLGFAATCSPGGAGKWQADYSPWLNGANVIVLPDNDEPGREHAAKVAKALQGHAWRVRVLALPDLPDKGDAFDWIAAGGTAEHLEDLAEKAPEWAPPAAAGVQREAQPEALRAFGKLRLLSVDDALNAPARTYLLDGLLAPGEMSVWWGRPKCGKSFLMLRLAFGLAQGRGMWGREGVMVPVLYVAAEGESGIKGRIRALHDTLGTAPNFSFIAQRVDLFDPDADLTDLIAAANTVSAGFVVIDTLARTMGAGDENKAQDMNVFVSNLDRIREDVRTRPHVAVIHHGGWDGNHARGSIALVGAADLVVKVGGEEGGPRSATVEYAKDDAGNDLLGFKLDVVELPADEKGRLRSTCIAVDENAQPVSAETGAPLSEEQRGWLRDLQNMFDQPGLPEVRSPHSDMKAGLTLTREQVRAGFRSCGRLDAEADGKLTGKDRQRMSAMLNRLRDKGKIGMTEKLVWLL